MKMGGSQDDGRLAEINIIPLVDIMLVLLIIFMVAAPMLNNHDMIKVNMPEVSAAGAEAAKDDVVLSIDELGQIFLNGDPDNKFPIGVIEEKLTALYKDRVKKEIYLRADKDIRYGYVVEVMAACQRAGIQYLGMVTVPPEEKS